LKVHPTGNVKIILSVADKSFVSWLIVRTRFPTVPAVLKAGTNAALLVPNTAAVIAGKVAVDVMSFETPAVVFVSIVTEDTAAMTL
jgi:hypothetical protein